MIEESSDAYSMESLVVNLNTRQIIAIMTVISVSYLGGCSGDPEGNPEPSSQSDTGLDVASTKDTTVSDTDLGLNDDGPPTSPDEGVTPEEDTESTETDEGNPTDEDTTPPVPSGGPYNATCETTPDCSLPCGSGTCKDGQCQFIPKPGFCIVPAGDDVVACVEGGTASDDFECLRCNPEVNGLDWTSMLMACSSSTPRDCR